MSNTHLPSLPQPFQVHIFDDERCTTCMSTASFSNLSDTTTFATPNKNNATVSYCGTLVMEPAEAEPLTNYGYAEALRTSVEMEQLRIQRDEVPSYITWDISLGIKSEEIAHIGEGLTEDALETLALWWVAQRRKPDDGRTLDPETVRVSFNSQPLLVDIAKAARLLAPKDSIA